MNCPHCGSDAMALVEVVRDGDDRVEIYECQNCGHNDYRGNL